MTSWVVSISFGFVLEGSNLEFHCRSALLHSFPLLLMPNPHSTTFYLHLIAKML